jgi:hypothetical protein
VEVQTLEVLEELEQTEVQQELLLPEVLWETTREQLKMEVMQRV